MTVQNSTGWQHPRAQYPGDPFANIPNADGADDYQRAVTAFDAGRELIEADADTRYTADENPTLADVLAARARLERARRTAKAAGYTADSRPISEVTDPEERAELAAQAGE